jgi:protein-S-isoprenylcysteine O-methyltransferase Ste14
MAPQQTIYWLWDAWLVSWMVAAVWAARASARAPVWSELWRDALAVAGAVILFSYSAPMVGPAAGPPGGLRARLLEPLWQVPDPAGWGLAALTLAGLVFSWWARLHIGALWSGFVGRKADHRVVDTGPYRLVRHPIYTGLLAAALAMALIKGTAAAIAGLALVTAGIWLKARLEERFLRDELGAETYDAYRRRTPMLLPFAPRIG